MKLELKHIAPYLPYGLKFRNGKEFDVVTGIDNNTVISLFRGHLANFTSIEEIKPILRPLSDLTKEIEVNGTKYESVEHYFEEIYYTQTFHKQVKSIIQDERWINHCEYILVEFLFEHHFDVFGLIPQGLAIDFNTLES